MSETGKRWSLANPAPESFAKQFPEYSKPVIQLLHNRGLSTDDAVGHFLQPLYTRDLHNPRLLRGLDTAVGTIHQAIAADHPIVIHGDYDADGITATALLKNVLERLGGKVEAFIPDRYTEGYGVSEATLSRLHAEGAALVITVDCGISSAKAIAAARRKGLKVIVTDHHIPPKTLPEAEAVINPHQPGDQYPNKALTGVGVAFKLAQGLLSESKLTSREQEATEKWLLDLVALGTVADLASLTGENRTLVKFGLIVLAKTKRVGLRMLMQVAGIDPAQCDSATIGYRLAPRLNAAGRIKHAKTALQLLLTTDLVEAAQLAQQLNELNLERQQVTSEAFVEAKKKLGPVTDDDRIIVLDGKWLAGIVGLVAGKLAQEYYRPALIIERGRTVSRGSARSIPALNIVEALAKHRSYLSTYGGHAGAAGFSLPTVKLAEFRQALENFGRQALTAADLRKEVAIESVIEADDMTFDFLEQLSGFEPFGIGNPKPAFLLPGAKIEQSSVVGKDASHLKLRLRLANGEAITALAFGLAEHGPALAVGNAIDSVGIPVANTFNHTQSLEWHVNDFRRT